MKKRRKKRSKKRKKQRNKKDKKGKIAFIDFFVHKTALEFKKVSTNQVNREFKMDRRTKNFRCKYCELFFRNTVKSRILHYQEHMRKDCVLFVINIFQIV